MKQDGPWDCINVIASSKEAFYVDAVESFLFEEGGGEYQYLRVAKIFHGLWGRNFVGSKSMIILINFEQMLVYTIVGM